MGQASPPFIVDFKFIVLLALDVGLCTMKIVKHICAFFIVLLLTAGCQKVAITEPVPEPLQILSSGVSG